MPEVTLSLIERRTLSSILAGHEGGMDGTLKAIREAREAFDLTEEELKNFTILWPGSQGFELRDKPCNESMTCQMYPEKCRHRDKSFAINGVVDKLIRRKLKKLYEDNKLLPGAWSLLEKFEVLDKEAVEANGELAKV